MAVWSSPPATRAPHPIWCVGAASPPRCASFAASEACSSAPSQRRPAMSRPGTTAFDDDLTSSNGAIGEPTSGAAAIDPRRRTLVLATMCLALLLVIAGVSMLAVGLSRVGQSLHLSQTNLTWVADAYAL